MPWRGEWYEKSERHRPERKYLDHQDHLDRRDPALDFLKEQSSVSKPKQM